MNVIIIIRLAEIFTHAKLETGSCFAKLSSEYT